MGVRSRVGFSMVEVLVALVLLSVGLLGVAGLTTTALEALSRARMAEEGVAGMESALDSLRRFGFSGAGERRLTGGLRVRWEAQGAGDHGEGAEVEVRLLPPEDRGEGTGEWDGFRVRTLVSRSDSELPTP